MSSCTLLLQRWGCIFSFPCNLNYSVQCSSPAVSRYLSQYRLYDVVISFGGSQIRCKLLTATACLCIPYFKVKHYTRISLCLPVVNAILHSDNTLQNWVSELRNLGRYTVKSTGLKCSCDSANKTFTVQRRVSLVK